MVVGVCRVTLMVPESHSLKEKRMVLRRIKDRVANKFNCAIAEVGVPVPIHAAIYAALLPQELAARG